VKELADIRNNGTPEGIAAYSIDRMDEWVFTISVLGDETVYRVCPTVMAMGHTVLCVAFTADNARARSLPSASASASATPSSSPP